MSIPKVIHYVWLSGDKKPGPVKKCLASWRKVCPDYEIKEWTAADLDMEANSYVRQTYAMKKWSWLTDYFRLWILYNYGGIYLDSDVEVLKPFDPFLIHKAFTCLEHNSARGIEAAVIGAEAGLPIFTELLAEYNVDYKIAVMSVRGQKSINFDVIPVIMADVLERRGLVRDNSRQTAADFEIYPSDYFSCKSNLTLQIETTSNSVCIHHFQGSWIFEKEIIFLYKKKYGKGYKIMLILNKPLFSFKLFRTKLAARKTLRRSEKYGGILTRRLFDRNGKFIKRVKKWEK